MSVTGTKTPQSSNERNAEEERWEAVRVISMCRQVVVCKRFQLAPGLQRMTFACDVCRLELL